MKRNQYEVKSYEYQKIGEIVTNLEMGAEEYDNSANEYLSNFKTNYPDMDINNYDGYSYERDRYFELLNRRDAYQNIIEKIKKVF